MFSNAYSNRRVLITGHTGFKGSWLARWLKMLGAQVSGISLPPETTPNHWDLLSLGVKSDMVDIRDLKKLRVCLQDSDPEIVFHLAAQPLVRRSYKHPIDTWNTNVIGTANVLENCRLLKNLKAIVVITTDKCYENKEWAWGYREIDSLGGIDPYSASKAAAELVTASYRHSFFASDESPLIATARAGNVIGGGDWSEDRLIPDLVRAFQQGSELEIRAPNSTRPWQHVLECLSGYLQLGQKLLEGDRAFAEAWNFGPEFRGNRKVIEVLRSLSENWEGLHWKIGNASDVHEAKLLHLDSTKSYEKLIWCPVWTFEEGVQATAEWYKAWINSQTLLTDAQLVEYTKLAEQRNIIWSS
jgi:CDP-glucose 4,6-dehydratase